MNWLLYFIYFIFFYNVGSPSTVLKAAPGGMGSVFSGALSSSPELSSCIKACIGADGGTYSFTYPEHLNLSPFIYCVFLCFLCAYAIRLINTLFRYIYFLKSWRLYIFWTKTVFGVWHITYNMHAWYCTYKVARYWLVSWQGMMRETQHLSSTQIFK